jgi:hypothetical protein
MRNSNNGGIPLAGTSTENTKYPVADGKKI